MAKTLNAGSALTEFGSVGEHQPHAEHEIKELIHSANKRLQSWAYWSYESVHPQPTSNLDEGMYNGSNHEVDLTKFYTLTQPYCRAVQGRHLSMNWDPNVGMKLELKLHLDPFIDAPTEVYLGSWKPKTVRVVTTPANAVTWQREGSLLYMFATSPIAQDVSVDIHISMDHMKYVGPPRGMELAYEGALIGDTVEDTAAAAENEAEAIDDTPVASAAAPAAAAPKDAPVATKKAKVLKATMTPVMPAATSIKKVTNGDAMISPPADEFAESATEMGGVMPATEMGGVMPADSNEETDMDEFMAHNEHMDDPHHATKMDAMFMGGAETD